jgi:adenylate cyclase
MATLFIFHRSGRSDFQLADHNVLGRHPKNRIKVMEPGVSKVHCLISREKGGGFMIRDLGSRNGTFVNGMRISDRCPIGDGDEILLGNTRCLFREKMAATVIHVHNEPDILDRIQIKISPLRLNRFFPEANIIDEEMLRSDYERLRISFQLSRDIGFDLHVDFILGRVLDRAHEVLDFDYGVVFLAEEDGGLKPQSYKTKTLEERISIPAELLEHVREEKKGVLVSDSAPKGSETAEAPAGHKMCSMMAIPILYELDFLGIIVVKKTAMSKSFGERELHLLSNVANKSAMFIRNSQIAKRVTRESLNRERFRKIVSPEVAEMIVSGQVAVEPRGQLRDTAVMVAVLLNFSELSEFSAPDIILETLNLCFESLVEPIFRLEGMVDHCGGDRLQAVWGAPLAHEDDPIRAVRAALDMGKQIEAFNRKLSPRHIGPFKIGIGIDTGAAVAGNLGAGWTSRYTIIGDVMGSANALASSAEADQTVISENVYYIVRRAFDAVPLDAISYRGASINRYGVLAERPSSADTPWTHLG